MSGRVASWLLAAALVLALAGQSLRLYDRLGASITLNWAERASNEARRLGRAGAGVWRAALPQLMRAAERDPVEVGIPTAIGSLHLLLDSPQPAISWYRESLALEAQPETYLYLGLAQTRSGDLPAARESFAIAVKLDPRLLREVPEALRPAPTSPAR